MKLVYHVFSNTRSRDIIETKNHHYQGKMPQRMFARATKNSMLKAFCSTTGKRCFAQRSNGSTQEVRQVAGGGKSWKHTVAVKSPLATSNNEACALLIQSFRAAEEVRGAKARSCALEVEHAQSRVHASASSGPFVPRLYANKPYWSRTKKWKKRGFNAMW